MIKLKRAYDKPERADGYRVLVDRLWPRGIKKENLQMDEWAKEIAPSPAIRKKFGHNPDNWDVFRKEYKKELSAPEIKDKLRELAKLAKKRSVTLLYAAHDPVYNQAQILKQVIEGLNGKK